MNTLLEAFNEAPLQTLAEHLTACDDCAALYAEFATLRDRADSGTIPPSYPDPDLSFLPTDPEKPA